MICYFYTFPIGYIQKNFNDIPKLNKNRVFMKRDGGGGATGQQKNLRQAGLLPHEKQIPPSLIYRCFDKGFK